MTNRVPHLLREMAVSWAAAAFVAPRLPVGRRRRMAAGLARRTLRAFSVRVSVRGAVPPAGEPLLVVANHISWLDIYVLNAFVEARFVAKSEMARWPIVGRISRGFDAVHIVRGSVRDAARVKDRVAKALSEGERVVVFPEATTTDGTRLLRFHAAMFQAAIDARARVLPVALRYRSPDGTVDTTPAFIDDMSFVESLRRVLGGGPVHAEAAFGLPLTSAGSTRRALAHAAHAWVAGVLGMPGEANDEPRLRPDRFRLAG